jgi:hypothetical protein
MAVGASRHVFVEDAKASLSDAIRGSLLLVETLPAALASINPKHEPAIFKFLADFLFPERIL